MCKRSFSFVMLKFVFLKICMCRRSCPQIHRNLNSLKICACKRPFPLLPCEIVITNNPCFCFKWSFSPVKLWIFYSWKSVHLLREDIQVFQQCISSVSFLCVLMLLVQHDQLLTLKCIRGGPLRPMILFFASPVKTRKDFFRSFLVIAKISVTHLLVKKIWYRPRHFHAN